MQNKYVGSFGIPIWFIPCCDWTMWKSQLS